MTPSAQNDTARRATRATIASVDPADVDAIVARIGASPDRAIPLLQALQERYNYLPEAALRRVADTTGIRAATLVGIATFYTQFRLKPAGRHTVRVCIGTACHVKGANAVHDAFKQYLRIGAEDDTDADRLFTVQKVACLGCCMLAPAVRIDDITYGFVEPRGVRDVLRDFLDAQQALPGGGAPSARDASDIPPTGELRLCLCSSCEAGGAAKVYAALRRELPALGIRATVRSVGCTGRSYLAPELEVAMADGRTFRYGLVDAEHVRDILLRHFRPPRRATRVRTAFTRLLDTLYAGAPPTPVTRFLVDAHPPGARPNEAPQHRIVTEHAGELDPLDYAAYRAAGGFTAFEQCLAADTPDAVIEAVLAAGLRGRGGAGFLTGRKWRTVHDAPGNEKYLVCNGDEGDPGAFMDRMILESFPFRVIEGILIAAHAVGCLRAMIYIRAEYPLATQRVRRALDICRREGLLGADAFGKGRPFDVDVVEGAGAFVCGEETALLAALEGARGTPRYRPPYPALHGYRGRPTLVNNVETLALVPWIVRHGADAFARLGSGAGTGTKTFALAGKVRRGGLIEVPMGMTIRQIVEEVGGGVANGRTFKAVQIGGPSGGCVPAALADTPIDYEALTDIGAIMGSGGLVVLDETDCMVDIARYFMSFTQLESCGKCTFCRIGTKRMLEILDRLCAGRGKPDDLDRLDELAAAVRQGSLCGLGRTAPNPVLSLLTHFRDEFVAHIERRCPAGKCKALIQYRIDAETCIGCTRCAQRCPVDAISGRPYEAHAIDPAGCVRCDTCRQVCPVDAVRVGELDEVRAAPDTERRGRAHA